MQNMVSQCNPDLISWKSLGLNNFSAEKYKKLDSHPPCF